MNITINLIKKSGDLYDLIVRNRQIIEVYHDDTGKKGILRFYIYDPRANKLTEIEPDLPKSDLVNIQVSYKPCKEIYFAVIREAEDDMADVEIYGYDLEMEQTRMLCSLRETRNVLTGEKRIRVFILSRTLVLVQTEIVDVHASHSLMGSIIFAQALYDVATGQAIDIIEENLKNNGINMIAPLNDSEVMIKTGFSFLEDSRLSFDSDSDALIESIYITTISKFTADISLKQKNIDMKLLLSTYVDRFILRPKVKDDYILYNVVDINAKTSDCVFYNFVTDEKIIGKNTDIDLEDMRLAYVVSNTPYVRKYVENSCEFVNMLSVENDISFYDEDFVDICGDLFITSRQHRRSPHVRIYKYPHMDVIAEERCQYISGVRCDNAYYLYIR